MQGRDSHAHNGHQNQGKDQGFHPLWLIRQQGKKQGKHPVHHGVDKEPGDDDHLPAFGRSASVHIRLDKKKEGPKPLFMNESSELLDELEFYTAVVNILLAEKL